MSTLNVANVTDGTTTVGTNVVLSGCAKAWVNFNGTGTLAIRDSENISSITDVATGDYRVNFSNAFLNGNYISLPASGRDITTDTGNVCTITYTTSTTDISTFAYGANTRQDVSIVGLGNFGDLA